MSKNSMRHHIARIAIVGLLAAPAAVATSGVAFAAGTSTKTNGCYVQWWNTAWEAKCLPALATGDYSAHVDYSQQGDYHGPWRGVKKGTNHTFDSGTARFAVNGKNTYVTYKG